MGEINYRLAKERDLDAIFDLVTSAITEMESHGIFQWDEVYPTRDDFGVEKHLL